MNLGQNNWLDEYCIDQTLSSILVHGLENYVYFNIDIFLNIIRQNIKHILPKPAVKFAIDSSCLKCVYL